MQFLPGIQESFSPTPNAFGGTTQNTLLLYEAVPHRTHCCCCMMLSTSYVLRSRALDCFPLQSEKDSEKDSCRLPITKHLGLWFAFVKGKALNLTLKTAEKLVRDSMC